MKNINDTLINLRKDKGLTQQEVADALFISNKTISKWENGDSIPDIQTMVDIANFYQVPLSTILTKDDRLDSVSLNKVLKVITISTLINLSVLVLNSLFIVKGVIGIFVVLINLICIITSIVSSILLRKFLFSNIRNVVIFCFYFNILSVIAFLIIILACLFF